MQRLSPAARRRAGRIVLTVGLVYELIALWHPKVPTITDLRAAAHRHPLWWPAAEAFDALWDRHFGR